MIRGSNQEFRNVVRMHTLSLERCRKQEEESPAPLLDFEEVNGTDIQKAHATHSTHSAPGLSLTPAESLHWNGTSSKGGPGGYGRAGPPQEGERTLHRNKQTRVLLPQPATAERLDGAPRRLLPQSIPLGQTFHDDMAPCRMGPWDPQEEWVCPLPVLAVHICCPVRAGALSWLQC